MPIPISRVLVANRGEIALRIIRACHEEGLEAVAVYSEADRSAPYVRAANAAVPIGPSPAAQSYLVMDKIIAAARATGAQAIHPGFGFLSERAAFAAAVVEAGLVFVGPPASAIQAMGDKTEARRRMQAAGVPVVPGAMTALTDPAVAAARAVGYRSAGTCEFLLASDGSFFFLEMNTRIQVEHPVTELVYGVDLVREQLRIAQGLPMTVAPGSLSPRGWAIECRITSEDPANNFLPSTGRITYLKAPAGPGIRWDSGVETGDEVTLFYDSMLAKLIVHGATRLDAIVRMERALAELVITGVATNQPFHLRLLADSDFRAGRIDIQFLERRPDLIPAAPGEELIERLAVVAALAEEERRQRQKPAVAVDDQASSAWLARGRAEGLR